jgi:hypothetical protein
MVLNYNLEINLFQIESTTVKAARQVLPFPLPLPPSKMEVSTYLLVLAHRTEL